jgi:GT2 family glycosyltransferase
LYRRWRSPKAPTKSYIGPEELKVERKYFQTAEPGLIAIKRCQVDVAPPERLGHVSVVIPTYNPDSRLRDAIMSLPPVAEIIVVDDASMNGAAAEICADLQTVCSNLTYLRNEKNLSFSATVNRGISETDAANDVFVFNDDAKVMGQALNDLADAAKRPAVGITTGLHINPINGMDTCLHPDTCPDWHQNGQRYVEMRWVGFCAAYIKREVIDEIGVLDATRYPLYSSDTDYCIRAQQAGFMVVCDTHVAIEHYGGRAVAQFRDADPMRFKQLAEQRIKCTPTNGS